MANPAQKTILLEQTYDELEVICTKFQKRIWSQKYGDKNLLRELARVYEKDIGEDYDKLKEILNKFQDESGATDMEVKTLLRELARVYEKDIEDD